MLTKINYQMSKLHPDHLGCREGCVQKNSVYYSILPPLQPLQPNREITGVGEIGGVCRGCTPVSREGTEIDVEVVVVVAGVSP